MTTLAQRIAEARTAIGIEPAELARRVGVKPSAAYQWESGSTKSLKADTAIALAEELGVDVVWLVTGRKPKAGAAVPSQSQPLQLDPNMLAETHRTLRELEEEEGRRFFLEEDSHAARFVQLYQERAAMPKHPSQEEWVQFGRKLAAMTARR